MRGNGSDCSYALFLYQVASVERREAILVLRSCSLYIDDEDRLQRVLPYVVALLSDPTAIVRCAAMETLCDILPLVRDFPPSDAKIFPEYIFPMLSTLPDDPEESVSICYASNIAKLALTAYGFLIHSFQLSDGGVLNELNSQQISTTPASETPNQLQKANGNVHLAQLRKTIAEVVQELVMGLKKTPNVRRALLQDIRELCFFFDQRQSNDFLLPILRAFLNDGDEQLRRVFFEKIVYVCIFVGQRSVEEYLDITRIWAFLTMILTSFQSLLNRFELIFRSILEDLEQHAFGTKIRVF